MRMLYKPFNQSPHVHTMETVQIQRSMRVHSDLVKVAQFDSQNRAEDEMQKSVLQKEAYNRATGMSEYLTL